MSATAALKSAAALHPSCGTAPKVVAVSLSDPVLTATPCKLDTSPSSPSCGAGPRS
jgi:hypothetical protein